MGVSPFVASKNKFEPLDEWEQSIEDQDEEMEEGEIAEYVQEYKTSQPSKKIKLEPDEIKQENFDEILKGFTDKDAEFAFSASEAVKRPTFKTDKTGKMKKMVPEEERVRENRKKVVINCETAGNLDATEMIQNFDDLYRNYHDFPDPEIVEVCQSILKNPRANEFDNKINEDTGQYITYGLGRSSISLSNSVALGFLRML